MTPMNKAQACRTIHRCATAYRDNLANKNVLFVAERGDIREYFEALFLTGNFQHLTGVNVTFSMTANAFFNLAVDDRLTEKDFKFTADGTSRMKLDVLPTLMKIHHTARRWVIMTALATTLWLIK